MRDFVIAEIAVREVSRYCEFADIAYYAIDTTGGQKAVDTYFFVHSFLSHCGAVARLLWSDAISRHASGRTIAQVIDMPGGCRLEEAEIREALTDYDCCLAQELESRGDIRKVLDFNIGNRDAFEEEQSIFLRHYDPTVDTLTLMEREIPLGLISAEMAEIKSRADSWLEANTALQEHAAEISIPRRT